VKDFPKKLDNRLWPHQRTAVRFAHKLLRDELDPITSLVRMPTGTGKTGVIALLSIALPPRKWTLVLTPWSNLSVQLIGDLREKFWRISEWRSRPAPRIERLFPSNASELLGNSDERLILVATFATLVAMFKQNPDLYEKLAGRLSQVFVDEGHYEPAVEWGLAVKNLRVPTLLLTATPYRNDLKLFKVDAANVFHYTHAAAEHDGIIRRLRFHNMAAAEPKAQDVKAWCTEFADFWKAAKKTQLPKDARAIICCADMATVKKTTARLRKLGINALGIHDRFGKDDETWFVKDAPDPSKVTFDVWVHQHKLTEGLDDKRFRVVAILNRIRNDRKLIQQIGRVLRRSPDDDQPAIILYSAGLQVKRSWDNYRKFELQSDLTDPLRYKRALEALLKAQPEMEYFGGQFRERFESSRPSLKDEIRLLPSVIVRKVTGGFKLNDCAQAISDFLVLDDAILIGPADGYEISRNDARLWVYAMFSNYPLLISGSHYEIRLGALAAVQHGNLLFLTDTEGKYPDVYVTEHTRKLTADDLGKILTESTVPHEVSLQNPWPAGPSVKRSSVYADNLAMTSTSLTDSIFMCTSVRAAVPANDRRSRRRHYLGFTRGRISEQLQSTERNEFSLDDFIDWTEDFASDIASNQRNLPSFFHRYLEPVEAPIPVNAAYLVLNLFEGDVELEDDGGNLLHVADNIIELRTSDANSTNPRFTGKATFCRLTIPEAAETYDFSLTYFESTNRFKLQGEKFNTAVLIGKKIDAEKSGIVTYLNNNDELFTVAMSRPDIFYNAQAFYKIDYTFAETRIASLLTTEPLLQGITSEKGSIRSGQKNWQAASLFGVIDKSRKEGIIAKYFPDSDFVFCDDLGKEIADFVCVSFATRKIVLVHAKHGGGSRISASALHVVVAQALKNLGVLGRSGPLPAEIRRWNRTARWNVSDVPRWRVGKHALPEDEQLWEMIRSQIIDHPDGKKEVWLVLGATLRRQNLLENLSNSARWNPVTGQMVYLLSSLNATCSQLQVSLRLFCD